MPKREGKSTINFPGGRSVESTPETRAEAEQAAVELREKKEAEAKATASKPARKSKGKEE
ncbi:MAG: hypothetical protein ACN4GR_01660 [Arenicellales bacterium]